MEEYTAEKCNIRNCERHHYKTFLCDYHYSKYITNSEIQSYLERLERLINGNSSWKDKCIFWRNGIVHYTTYLSTYYIEHFKLETLFTYHYKNTDLNNNPPFDPEEFIHDFDYEENDRMGFVRTSVNARDSQDRILKFVEESILPNNIGQIYIFLYLLFLLLYIVSWHLNIKSHQAFFIVLVALSLGYPILITGKGYINGCREILKQAIENNLYKKIEENNKFILSCESIFNRRQLYRELIPGYGGYMLALISISLYSLRSKIIGQPWYEWVLIFFMIVTALYAFRWLLKVLWVNYFFMPLSRRFQNEELNFQLYNLNQSFGMEVFKTYIRRLFLYDLIVIFSLYTLLPFVRDQGGIVALFGILFFITGWNFSSLFIFIPKLIKLIRHQFKNAVKDEKNRLSNSNEIDRFNKYEFLEKLKPKILFDFKIIKTFLLACVPFIIGYILDHIDREITVTLLHFWQSLKDLDWIFK